MRTMVLVYKNLQNWVILDKGSFVGGKIFQHHGELIWDMKPYETIQDEAPKIAKLVYKWFNYGLW